MQGTDNDSVERDPQKTSCARVFAGARVSVDALLAQRSDVTSEPAAL